MVAETTIDVPASSGGYVVRETVRFVFFVRKRHLDAVPKVVEAIETLVDLFPPPALSDIAGPTGDWFMEDAQGLKAQVREKFLDKDAAINGSVSLAGNQANIPDVAVEYVGRAIDRPIFKEAACALWFYVARPMFETYRKAALRLSLDITRRLDCSAAYVDLALEGDKRRKQMLAQRYLNIDISNVSNVARDIGNRMPGVFWRNFLGSELVTALGGPDAVASILSKQANIETDESGGIFVTMGAEPTRGDINRRENLTDRIALANFADSKQLLHTPRKVTYFEPTDSLSDSEAQERWHQRFLSLA
jgi:hypothetical protein